MKKTVTVAESHVRRAVTLIDDGGSLAQCCPVALALADTLGETCSVVSGNYRVFSFGTQHGGTLPDHVCAFILDFDDDDADIRRHLPVVFEIEVPQ